MLVSEVLTRARALYASAPSHAPRGTAPVDGACPIQAIYSVDRILCESPANKALAESMGLTTWSGIMEWNAKHTTEEVLAAFDQAVSEAKAREFTAPLAGTWRS